MPRILPVVAGLLLPVSVAAQPVSTTPTIQVTSRIVYVDVIVRNNAGQIVHGLTQNNFRILEDGKPQQVDYFTEHVYDSAAPMAEPASSLEFSNTGTRGQADTVTILLFDLLNTSTGDQLVARQQMLKFLGELPPGRRISLFTLTDKLQMIQGSTGNPELLTAAANMLKPVNLHHMPSREEVQENQDQAREFDRESAPAGHGGLLAGGSAMDNVQTQNTDLNLRKYATISALMQLARMMSPDQGRKNLFWISESFPIALNTTQNYLHQTLPVDAHRMTNVLADARIAVYPVSVLGLDLGTSMVAFSGTPGNLPDPTAPFFPRGNLKSAMDDIANQTGGEAIVGTNDLAGAMRRDLDDGANYYTLAYQPQNRKWNKQFRKIHVELSQKGDSLTYRSGYFAYPDNPSAQNPVQGLNAALQPGTPDSTMLSLRSTVDLPNSKHSGVLVHSVLNAASLNLPVDADGHRRGKLLVMLIAFNGSAKPEDQPSAPPQTSGVLNLDLDPAQYQNILANGLAFTQQLSLPAGPYRLRLGASDLNSGRLGTLDMPITIANR